MARRWERVRLNLMYLSILYVSVMMIVVHLGLPIHAGDTPQSVIDQARDLQHDKDRLDTVISDVKKLTDADLTSKYTAMAERVGRIETLMYTALGALLLNFIGTVFQIRGNRDRGR